jgi:glycosyltransferase involved in cell wall biosynthesis
LFAIEMNARLLVVITTRLPPQVCGIGAYSWLLHRHWPDRNLPVQFLVVDGAIESAAELDFPDVTEFSSNATKLSRALDHIGDADLFLHYAGRAYHRYGCPNWLPSVLSKWRAKFRSGRSLVFFHELSGNFPVTSRHYWIDMCNRRVIRKLSKIADAVVTNTSEHAEKLKRISRRADIHWLPVPSNIPATGVLSALRAGAEFVIFGLPFGRWQTLQLFDAEIRSWQESGHLTRLHLIGPRDQKFDARSDQLINSWRDPNIVMRHGMLPPADISRILARAQFGLSNATVENWSKSAVFMAFASHGCAVVSKARCETAPLRFTVAPDEVATMSDVDLGERTKALRRWYEQHAHWNVIARKISALFPDKVTQTAVV